MKKSLYGIKPYYYLIFIGVALVFFIIGSFTDLSVAKALYDPNNVIANTCETWLIGISFSMVTAAGGLIMASGIAEKRLPLKIFGIIFSIVAFATMVYLYSGFIYRKPVTEGTEITYLNIKYGYGVPNQALAYVLAIVILLIPYLLAFFFCDKSNPSRLLRIGLIICLAFLAEHLTLELVKYLDMRPRYRFLVEEINTTGATFRNWWEFAPYSQTGGDCFKSFPSGHTGAAAVTLLSPLIIACGKHRFNHDQLVFFLIGCSFVLFVAIFRMIAGAHFLSDVSAGAIVSGGYGLLAVFLGARVIKPEEEYRLEKRA